MTRLVVAACLWDANENSAVFSRCYTDEWVEKLYRGFARNLTVPFRFVLFTDRTREFDEPIEQWRLLSKNPDYGCLTEPYRLNEPMILCGLDTIIVRNVDHMAQYCLTADKIAVPRDPYQPQRAINAISLVPAGHRRVFDEWRGENDMDWIRQQDTIATDDLFPGEILSLKFHDVRRKGLQNARICYFHGRPKPDELGHLPWVREHWA